MNKLKTLLVALAAVVGSAAHADNKAIQQTSVGSHTESYRLLVPWEVLGYGSLSSEDNANPDVDYSVGAWVNVSAINTTDNGQIMSLAPDEHNNNNAHWQVRMTNSNDLSFYFASGDNQAGDITGLSGSSIGTINKNEWHHILTAVDNTNKELRVFVDGELKLAKTLSAPLTFKGNKGKFRLLAHGVAGALDQAEFFDSALNDDEVTEAFYDAQKVSSIRAIYTFDELGTETGKFSNTFGEATEMATYEKCTGPYYYWSGGVVDATRTPVNPSFVEGRTIQTVEGKLIEVSTAGGGRVWIGDDKEAASIEIADPATFSPVIIHAEANANYEFTHWTHNGETVSTEAEYTIAECPEAIAAHYVAHFQYAGNTSVHIFQTSHRLMIHPSALDIDCTNIAEAKTKSYSVGMWFKQTNSASESLLMNFSTANHNNCNGNWCMQYSTYTGKIGINSHPSNVNGLNDGTKTDSEYDGIKANEWNHVLVTIDQPNKTFKAYVNGQLAKTIVIDDSQDGIYLNVDQNEKETAHFMFGSYNFSGYIDEVQLFNTPLTQDEVELVYEDVWYTKDHPRATRARITANNKGGAYNIESLAALYTFDNHSEGDFADLLSQTTTPSFVENVNSANNTSIGDKRVKQTTPTIAEAGREIKANNDTDTPSSINQVDAAIGNGAVEYFDMQGRRVAEPGHGLYIRRQGTKAAKVIL